MEIKFIKKYSLFKKEEIRPASIGAALLFSFCQYLLIETGIRNPFAGFEPVSILYICAGVFDLLYLNLILILLTGRKSAAFAVTTVAALVLSLVNHYTWLLHGEPFTFDDLKNAGTAMGVLESYRLELTPQVLLIILGAIVLFFAGFPVFRLRRSSRKLTAKCMLVLLPLVWLFLMTGKVIPKSGFGWSWKNAVNTYGYLPSMLRESRNRLIPYHKPAGYDRNETVGYMESYDSPDMHGENRPDVILILNETFYDFDRIADIDTDGQVFTRIPELDNCIRGYTVVPGPGGGTNKSEYELLTSNSLHQITSGTPFNMLDLEGANSVVTYMKNRGYQTLGTHPQNAANYNREIAYPALGFDQVRWIGDYSGLEHYGDRPYPTDASVYRQLTEWYEQMGDSPRFIYCLTMQNHGDWDLNDSSQDSIHVLDDYGEYTDQLSEFMSCVSLSDQAFGELTDYYRNVDRDVIIIMTGDHCPHFTLEMMRTYTDWPDEVMDIPIRSTPFVIWANHEGLLEDYMTAEQSALSEESFSVPVTIGINELVPSALQAAGMPLSGYYSSLCDLRARVPVLHWGLYLDQYGIRHEIEEKNEYREDLRRYFSLEYLNLTDGDKYPFFQ